LSSNRYWECDHIDVRSYVSRHHLTAQWTSRSRTYHECPTCWASHCLHCEFATRSERSFMTIMARIQMPFYVTRMTLVLYQQDERSNPIHNFNSTALWCQWVFCVVGWIFSGLAIPFPHWTRGVGLGTLYNRFLLGFLMKRIFRKINSAKKANS
jgi:hypothetical protein